MIDQVSIAGQPIDPGIVLFEITAIHGRKSIGEALVPSSATIVLDHPQGSMPTWQSGDTITATGPDGPMFAGRIVSRALAHVDKRDDQGGITRWGRFTLSCAGPASVLGVRPIGDTPWPAETGTARASRILAASGVPWAVDGTVDLQVLARDVDRQPAGGLLDELASWTSAAVFDTPDGRVVYQALSGRQRPVIPYRWDDFDPALTWSGFDPALTWDGASPSIGDWISPTSEVPLPLPASAVLWEPQWAAAEAAVINSVRVGYGVDDPQAHVDLEDAASIAQHGRRYVYQGTQLAGAVDATARASHIITTQAAERWQIGDVTVALERLDPDAYARALHLVCGDHVTLQGLPQPAPAIDWTGIVEGWTYNQWADDTGLREELVLALSDPLLSLAVMRWDDYPALYQWATHPDYLTWDDLGSVNVLEAA